MVFNSKEDLCAIEILKILSKGRSRYTKIYSKLDYYINTYQKAIKFLVDNELILREELGYKNVRYTITEKGFKFLNLNMEARKIIVLQRRYNIF